jgi:glycosyltransferase involved in cell wall biosynthesis
MNSRVSIITPSFNRADIIHETAESIFNQTYADWEWVIVDDGSTDESWQKIEEYAAKDDRVKIFKRDRLPKGACTCRNIGVEKCSGDYVLFLDTDDIIEPFCIHNRLKSLQTNPQLDFGIFPSLMFTVKPYDLNLWWNIDKPIPEIIRQFHQDAICQGTGILIKKSAFFEVGLWNETLLIWQDIDLFFRLYLRDYKYKKFFNLPPDLHNRTNHTSLSRTNFFSKEKLNSRAKVLTDAVALTKEKNKFELLPEAKYMLTELISGFCRIRNFDEAAQLVTWGKYEHVLNNIETFRLKYYIQFFRLRLYKLPFIGKFATSIRKELIVNNTLGNLRYKT